MSFTIRLSGPADRTAILTLMEAARGDGLSPAQRAERGFVQGTMNAQVLSRFQESPGVFIAEQERVLAGFAMTSLPGTVAAGPAKLAVDSVTHECTRDRLFLYGPAAVDPGFQGRGVLTKLLAGLCAEFIGRFDRGVAFVETANAKSLAVHRRYGMTEAAHFCHATREYRVFTFDPAAFVIRTE